MKLGSKEPPNDSKFQSSVRKRTVASRVCDAGLSKASYDFHSTSERNAATDVRPSHNNVLAYTCFENNSNLQTSEHSSTPNDTGLNRPTTVPYGSSIVIYRSAHRRWRKRCRLMGIYGSPADVRLNIP